MSCKIEDIKDEDLQALVQQYGAKEGIKAYITKISVAKELGLDKKEINDSRKPGILKKLKERNLKNPNERYRIKFKDANERGTQVTWELIPVPSSVKEVVEDEESPLNIGDDFYMGDEFLREQNEKEGEFSVSLSDDTPKDSFPIQSFNVRKILKGEKTLSIRPSHTRTGTYLIGGNYFKVTNQGSYRLDDYLELTGKSEEEVREQFVGNEDIRELHIEDFFNNKVHMYVYDIKPAEGNMSITADSSIQDRALINLQATLNAIERAIKREKDVDRKQFLRTRKKSLQDRITNIKEEDNPTIRMILEDANVHLDEAKELVEQGNTNLARNYIATYSNLIQVSKGMSEDLIAQINLFRKKLSDLEAHTLEVEMSILGKVIGNTNEFMGENGQPKAYKADKGLAAAITSAAISNNFLVRKAYEMVSNAMNVIQVKQSMFKTKLNKIVKDLGKIKDPKQFYSFMLQKNSKGELTGYTVDKYNFKYVEDRAKNRLDVSDPNLEDYKIHKYLNWIKDNHKVKIDPDAYRDYIDYVSDKIKKGNYVEGNRTLEEIIDEKIENLKKYSDPNTFVRILKKDNGARSASDIKFIKSFLKHNKSYVSYEVTNPTYIDEQYQEIMNMSDTDPRKIFYDFYTTSIRKTRLEDNSNEHHVALNYIPELAEDVNLFKKISNMPYYMWGERPEDKREYYRDPVTGESSLSIPDGSMLNERLSALDKSYDLGKVLDKFITASINKQEKEKIEDYTKIIMNVVKSQPELRTVNGKVQYKDGVPEIVESEEKTAFNQLKYYLNANLYDKRQDQDGKFSKEMVDPELAKIPIVDLQLKMHKIDTKLSEEIDEAIKEKLRKEKEELLKKWNVLREEYTAEQYDELIEKARSSTKVVTGKQLTNSLLHYTAIKNLSLNFFSGVSEMFQSASALYIEAAGGKFFNDSDLSIGTKKAIQLLKPSNKDELQIWFNNFPLINDFGYDTPQSDLTNKLFWFFRQSEKISKASLLFARLNNETATKKDGTKVPLLEALTMSEDGQLTLGSEYQESFEVGSDFRNLVTNQLHALSRSLLARDNQRDPISANKKAIWRLVGQFRFSWIFEGITRRFSEGHESELGSQKGYYRSLFWNNDGTPNIKRAGQILWTLQFHPERLKDFGIEGLDAENVRKALREFKIAASLMLVVALGSALAGSDDDDEDWDDLLGNSVVNFAWRFNRDLTYYINPESSIDILGSSPMASISTIQQGLNLIYAVGETGIGDPYIYEGTKREQLKIINKIEPLIPVWKGVKSSVNRLTD